MMKSIDSVPSLQLIKGPMNYNLKTQSIKKVCLDPYFVSTICFVAWMLFFDYQNIFLQYRLYQRWQNLKTYIIHYNFEIDRIKKEKKELAHNLDFLERIAREKYYMKREKEDLYVIVEE